MDHAAPATACIIIFHVDVICLRSGGGEVVWCAWVHHYCDDFKASFAEVVAVAQQ
jgi:hypothetical protein